MAAEGVGIPRNQKVYDLDVQLVPPTGRRRKPVPDHEPRAAEDVLAERAWRRVTWRGGTKGALTARFAALRVRVADGTVWANNRHLPGAEVWLVGEVSPGSCRAKLDRMADGGEWRSSGERKYYLSNLPRRLSVRALAAAIKARWVCEQAHQQLKGNWGSGTSRAAPGPDCTAMP
jgi:SRSO17 transposase